MAFRPPSSVRPANGGSSGLQARESSCQLSCSPSCEFALSAQARVSGRKDVSRWREPGDQIRCRCSQPASAGERPFSPLPRSFRSRRPSRHRHSPRRISPALHRGPDNRSSSLEWKRGIGQPFQERESRGTPHLELSTPSTLISCPNSLKTLGEFLSPSLPIIKPSERILVSEIGDRAAGCHFSLFHPLTASLTHNPLARFTSRCLLPAVFPITAPLSH